MQATQGVIGEPSIVRPLLRLAVPIILANVLQSAYQIIDAFWVGRLGADAVAAVSISFPFSFLALALGIGFSIAGATLIAQYFGARDAQKVGHIAGQSLLMAVGAAFLLGLIGYIVAPMLLGFMHVSSTVYTQALGFLRVSFIGLIPTFVFVMFQSIMRSIARPGVPVYIVLSTVLLNFILDPVFIFGWGPIAAYGVLGAALVTLLTQTVAATAGLVVLARGVQGVTLRLEHFVPDIAHMKRAFFLGLPPSFEMSMRSLSLMVMTFLVTGFGTASVAAYGAGANILQVVFIPALGLSMAIAALAGQSIGAGDPERAARVGQFGARLGFGVLTGIGAGIFFAAPALISFFVPGDTQVMQIGTTFLRIIAFSMGFLGVQLAYAGVLRAAGNMTTTMLLTIFSQWIIQLPFAYVLSKYTPLGIDGLWVAMLMATVLTALATTLVYQRGTWKTKRLTQEERVAERAAEEVIAEEAFETRQP